MTEAQPLPPARPGPMAQDGAIPRSGLVIPMPSGVKPPRPSSSGIGGALATGE
jgi:hypothetical protein